MRGLPTLLALLVVTGGSPRPAAAAAGATRRFAVLVAHPQGGEGAEPLRWAERDARKLQGALTELGGFAPDDTVLLVRPRPDAVLLALQAAERRVRHTVAAGGRALLLFYYSGHAAGGQLRLGGRRLPMTAIKEWLGRSGAGIRLAFLDACQSGAITRLKGGRRAPSFVVDVEPGERSRGWVVLTSSSEDEASQESEDLRGSFFTHYLVSGLRGAADRSGDGQVTLSELYAHTYQRTVAHTTGTRGGTQHPAYSYELRGNGAVVLTRLAGLGALVFPEAAEGTYLVYDVGRDLVVGEVEMGAGDRRRLSVPPGSYAVKKRADDHLLLQRVEVAARQQRVVEEGGFSAVAFEEDVTKGPAWLVRARTLRQRLTLEAHLGWEAFFEEPSPDSPFLPTGLLGVRVEANNLVAPRVSVHADVAVGRTEGSASAGPWNETFPLDFLFLTAGAGLSRDWWLGNLRLRVGPRVSGVYVRRDFADPSLPFQDLFTLCPGLEAAVAWWRGSLVLGAASRTSYLHYATEAEDRSMGFFETYMTLGYAP